jgi:hypothetical protein
LLGAARPRVERSFDEQWQARVQPSWQEHHQAVQQGRKRLAELDAKRAGSDELSLQEAYDHAGLIETHRRDPDLVLERFRELHARAPDDPVVLYDFGVRLLARDDDSGTALLERAMQLDEGAIVRCCEALRDYHWRHDRKEEAREWHRRMVERAELEQAAAAERNQVRLDEKFDRHDLDAGTLAELQRQLRTVKGLKKAYFVRKRVQHMTSKPCYVLGFSTGGFMALRSESRESEAMQTIQQDVSFPAETMIISVDGRNYRFGRKFQWMRGSRIV